MKRIALIDGDVLVYRCGFAAQHTDYYVYDKNAPERGWIAMFRHKKEAKEFIDGDDNFYIVPQLVVEPVANAIHNIKASMQAVMTDTQSDEYKFYLSGENNFREQIATIRPYKGNRDPDAKPVHYQALRDYCLFNYNAIIVDGQEADDALGIKQCHNLGIEEPYYDTIICSIDKDLNMIPGDHYNFVTKEKYFVDDETAMKTFYTQLLTGDVTDNVVGVPGIGPAKAEKLLRECNNDLDMYAVVYAEYSKAYEGADVQSVVNENARLLWIRRRKNELWNPPV